MSMIKKRKKGTTLAEVLIACGIFSFLVITLFAIIKFSLNNWRGIEDRAAVQTQIRNIQINLTESLTRSALNSVLVYNSGSDYRKALAFRTFMKQNIDGTFTPVTNEQGEPQSQGYVLFCLVRPAYDTCSFSAKDCPHKIVLRVDLTNNAGILDFSGSSPSLTEYIPQGSGTGGRVSQFTSHAVSVDQYKSSITASNKDYVKNVYVVGKNIISFLPVKQSNAVALTVKGFRELESGRFMTVADKNDLEASRFTIQVDSEIIPMNRNIPVQTPSSTVSPSP